MKIRLQDIYLEYQREWILDGLNLEFEGNKLTCLLGRSGSGKTSLLKIIAGISDPFKGKVYFDNEEVTSLPAQKREVGWVPQQQLLFPGMNVYDNIAYGLKSRRMEKTDMETRVSEVAELVGLTELLYRDPNGLSGGERQRVALARALAPRPKILLLDEPFSSLDAPERDRMALVFRDVQLQTGITTIHVTHNPREAELISDYTMILSNGKILQDAPINQLYANPKSTEVAKLLNISNVVEGGSIPDIPFDAIIPSDAITLGQGTISARVLTTTRSTMHLQVGKQRLEIDGSYDYVPGQILMITIKIDHIRKFG